MTVYRNLASFGKRQEFLAIAELLRRHFDVYLTLVDDQQIDCVIRQETNGHLYYLDIQIKARSEECNPNNAGRFAAMEIKNPREYYYYIFYSEQADMYWVIPSLQLVEEANQNKSGKNQGKYTINLCNVTAKGVIPRPKFKEYENAFHLLDFSGENMLKRVDNSKMVNPTVIPPVKEKLAQPSSKSGHRLSCCDEIKLLEGQILATLAQHKKFKLIEVTKEYILILVLANGKKRKISCPKELEPACKALKARGRLSRNEIEKEFSPRNPAYVAAILAKLPGVRYSLNPYITLFYG